MKGNQEKKELWLKVNLPQLVRSAVNAWGTLYKSPSGRWNYSSYALHDNRVVLVTEFSGGDTVRCLSCSSGTPESWAQAALTNTPLTNVWKGHLLALDVGRSWHLVDPGALLVCTVISAPCKKCNALGLWGKMSGRSYEVIGDIENLLYGGTVVDSLDLDAEASDASA